MENGNRLYICGTNAHNPKDYVIHVSSEDKLFFERELFGDVRPACAQDYSQFIEMY